MLALVLAEISMQGGGGFCAIRQLFLEAATRCEGQLKPSTAIRSRKAHWRGVFPCCVALLDKSAGHQAAVASEPNKKA